MIFDPPIRLTVVVAVAVAAAAVAIGLYWRGERAGSRRRAFLALLRTAALLGVGFLLLNPVRIRSTAGLTGKARFFIMLDASRSMAVEDVNARSRFAVAQQAVLEHASLLTELASRWDVRFFVFGTEAERTTLDGIREMQTPEGNRTDLGAALTTAAAEANRKGERAAGVLLVSDGRNNGETPPLAAARVARSAGLPAWTLCLGSTSATKDVSILTYGSQSFAFASQRTTLAAEACQQGYGATTLTVTLERDGEPAARQTISFAGDGRETVRFPVTEDSPGLYKYSVSIDPKAGETNTRNNKRSVFLRVINKKVKVLLLDARPSWDTKFLSHALRKDENVELTSIYRFARSRDYAVTTDKEAGSKKIRLPSRYEDLAPYEIVIVGKGFEDLLTDKGVDLLKRYLLERSGSVVFFRGKADQGSERLRDLEPVIWGGEQVRDLQLTLTEEGRQSPAFSLSPTAEPETVIRELPSLISATRVQGTKSLAVVLARGAGRGGADEPMATIAYQRYGDGRVMVIAGQGLWRWAFLPDELSKHAHVYRTFWSQVVRWLVSGSDFLPGQEFSLKTDRISYMPGQQVHLLIYAKRKPDPSRELRLDIIDPDGERVRISPSPSEAFGATFVGAFAPHKVGDYSVVLRTGPGEADTLEAAFLVAASQQEDALTAADPALMRQIAEVSGGQPITCEELSGLPSQIRDVEKRTLLQEQKTPLWDRPWVFLLLCGLLSMEWYLRRRGGLC